MTIRFRDIYSNAFNFLSKGPKLIRNTNETTILPTSSSWRSLLLMQQPEMKRKWFIWYFPWHTHSTHYASVNFNAIIPQGSLTISQVRPRWSGWKFSELISSASGELILSISLTCALCISESAVDHIKAFMNSVIFFSFTKYSVLFRPLSVVSQLSEQFLASWSSLEG